MPFTRCIFKSSFHKKMEDSHALPSTLYHGKTRIYIRLTAHGKAEHMHMHMPIRIIMVPTARFAMPAASLLTRM